MVSKTWQLQEAKNRFSEVVDRAMKDGAQTVTKHGKPAVVIVSVAEYQKAFANKKSWVELLRECPEDLNEIIPPRPKDVASSPVFDP